MGSARQQQSRPVSRGPAVKAAPRAAGPAPAAFSPRRSFASASPRHGLANGLPEPLKTNIEAMSGLAMDDVRVHRNSSRPAALGALAFAQGAEIHLGAGQERHLPHEAWHVVQQKQGRVAATRQMKGLGLNADPALEREATLMGERASRSSPTTEAPLRIAAPAPAIVQRAAISGEFEAEQKIAELSKGYHHVILEDRSWLVGPGPTYQYIEYKDRPNEWRKTKKGPFKLLGAGLMGRMVNSPASAFTIAKSWLGLTTEEIYALGRWKAYENTSIPAPPRIDDPGSNQDIMGRYFLVPASPLKANYYAQRQDCEWLHMHGHGLGGPNSPDNLFAGGHNANSQMLAIESVLKEAIPMAGLGATGKVQWRTMPNYHTAANCKDIADAVTNLDGKPVNIPATQALMGTRTSRLLTYLHYSVTSNKGSFSLAIDPQAAGRLDLAAYDAIYKTARGRIILGDWNWSNLIKPAVATVGAAVFEYLTGYLRSYALGAAGAPDS